METEFLTLIYRKKFVDSRFLDSYGITTCNAPCFIETGTTFEKIIQGLGDYLKSHPQDLAARNRLANIKKCKVVKVRIEIIE